MSTSHPTPSPEPTWTIVGDDEPLSDAAISALASLLLSLDDEPQGENDENSDSE